MLDKKNENLKYIFGQVNDRIKFADQKATLFASLNILWVLLQLNFIQTEKFDSCFEIWLLVVFIICWVLSIIFLLLIIYPRLDNKTKQSKIYFYHIANKYINDKLSALDDYEKLSDDSISNDLVTQIVENSIIARRKYQFLQILFLLFWIFVCLSIIVQFINK